MRNSSKENIGSGLNENVKSRTSVATAALKARGACPVFLLIHPKGVPGEEIWPSSSPNVGTSSFAGSHLYFKRASTAALS